MYCSCGGPVKPKIVFFGEALPNEFLDAIKPQNLEKVDLLLVLGTALAVKPFNLIIQMIKQKCPKVLFNMNNTKDTGGYDFTKGEGKLFVQGKCDETIIKLVKDCGWESEFLEVLPECHKNKL
jgi:NAD-dependent histone deacetylase SIR2